jgi:hypothetical protein
MNSKKSKEKTGTVHAFLSASSSHRWLNCPPSAKLCEEKEDSSSPYAKEGTDAHALCEYKVEKALGRNPEDPTADLDYYSEEMENFAESYCSFILEQVEKGFGTGDCVIIADDTLHIIDYKHGLGVLVSADHNPQIMCYALGALEMFDFIYDIKNIEMTIFQPRRENISTFSMTKDELIKWADETLAPTAALAYRGEGDFKAGSHCQFCKVKATCRKRAEYNLELAQYDFAMPATLEKTEIAAILPKIDSLISWASDLKEYALAQAINGTHYDGFKVVEGRSNRRYKDEAVVAATVADAGYDPYEKNF